MLNNWGANATPNFRGGAVPGVPAVGLVLGGLMLGRRAAIEGCCVRGDGAVQRQEAVSVGGCVVGGARGYFRGGVVGAVAVRCDVAEVSRNTRSEER